SVIPDMMRVGRLWNCNDIAAAHRPGKRDRSRGSACLACNFGQDWIIQQSSLFNWRISHQRNFSLYTPRHQVEFGSAPRQIIEYLVRGDLHAARDTGEFFHVVHVEIAHAPARDLACMFQVFESRDSLFQWIAPTPVQKVEIDTPGTEPLQASFTGLDGTLP